MEHLYIAVLPKRESGSSSNKADPPSSKSPSSTKPSSSRRDPLYSERTLAAASLSCAAVAMAVGFAAGVLCSAFLGRRKRRAAAAAMAEGEAAVIGAQASKRGRRGRGNPKFDLSAMQK